MGRLTNKNKQGFEIYDEEKLEFEDYYDKLKEYEDIEEKLNIVFIIGGKALLNGIITKHYGFIPGDCLQLEKARIYIPMYGVALPFYGPVGYGVTWALTKKELKNDK